MSGPDDPVSAPDSGSSSENRADAPTSDGGSDDGRGVGIYDADTGEELVYRETTIGEDVLSPFGDDPVLEPCPGAWSYPHHGTRAL